MIIGLTGGIGSGKTAVSDSFQEKGITIVDADVISRNTVSKGSPALEKIAEHFGESILLSDGNLDRAQLRKIVFDNPVEKQWLESLLHPLIGEETQRQLSQFNSPYVIYSSPLLIESGQESICKHIIVVDVPEELQIARTVNRDNNSEAQVKAIMANQASREQRLAKASHIIDNSGDLNHLHQQIEALHQEFLILSKVS